MTSRSVRFFVATPMDGFYFPIHQELSDYDKQYIMHHLSRALS